MAVTRALAGTGEQVTNTELTVTSALTKQVQTFLPKPGDGTGATAAEGATVTFISSTAAGAIEILSDQGFHVGRCEGKGNAVAVVQNGAWVMGPALDVISLKAGMVVANGTGATALGSLAPAAVGTVAGTAGWVAIVLSDGTKGYVPFWK